jgi:hypothetical protein
MIQIAQKTERKYIVALVRRSKLATTAFLAVSLLPYTPLSRLGYVTYLSANSTAELTT